MGSENSEWGVCAGLDIIFKKTALKIGLDTTSSMALIAGGASTCPMLTHLAFFLFSGRSNPHNQTAR